MGDVGFRTGLLLLVLLGGLPACRGRTLNFLERESLLFRADNEEIRVEDLEKRYEKNKARADRLSADLLALDHRRDELYEEYDALRAELVQARKQRDEAARALKRARAERRRLELALKKEEAALAKLKDRPE